MLSVSFSLQLLKLLDRPFICKLASTYWKRALRFARLRRKQAPRSKGSKDSAAIRERSKRKWKGKYGPASVAYDGLGAGSSSGAIAERHRFYIAPVSRDYF